MTEKEHKPLMCGRCGKPLKEHDAAMIEKCGFGRMLRQREDEKLK